MKNWYKNLENRYKTFPKSAQVLNMISDLKKAQHFEKTDPDISKNHILRALILIDYMSDDPKWKNGLRELRIFREAAASVIAGKPYAPLSLLVKTGLALCPEAYRQLNPGKSD